MRDTGQIASSPDFPESAGGEVEVSPGVHSRVRGAAPPEEESRGDDRGVAKGPSSGRTVSSAATRPSPRDWDPS
jgi:hypothetical protein